MKLTWQLALPFLTLVVISEGCGNRGNVTYGDNGIVVGGQGKLRCEKPSKRYAKEIDTSVKGEIKQLQNVPEAELDAKLKTTVVKLSDFSTQGLDRDLLLFRICEMSINRGLSTEQTTNLINNAMGVWDAELKKKNSSQN